MITQTTLPNGLRLILLPMENTRCVSMGVWVNAGSVYETEENNGISHFIEHMVFKGTKKRSARDIAVEMDAVGGNLNAFTAKECTCFYAKVLDSDLPLAVDILSDILLHSAFEEDCMEREKQVVIEEIGMSEDSPEDLCFETAGSDFYRGTVLEKTVLGTRETVAALTRQQIEAYMAARYTGGNMVIACAGSFEPRALTAMIEKAFADVPAGERDLMTEGAPAGRRPWIFRERDTEQVNTCLVLPGFKSSCEEYYAQAVLSNILGGKHVLPAVPEGAGGTGAGLQRIQLPHGLPGYGLPVHLCRQFPQTGAFGAGAHFAGAGGYPPARRYGEGIPSLQEPAAGQLPYGHGRMQRLYERFGKKFTFTKQRIRNRGYAKGHRVCYNG